MHIKDASSHLGRAQLKVRAQLVKTHGMLLGQLRGLLKLFGLRLGAVTTPAKRQARLKALFAQEPRLVPILTPLIKSIQAVETQLADTSAAIKAQAAQDPVCQRLMTIPGVGPMTALTFIHSIEDPGRFGKAWQVSAYAGLVPRRIQSGAKDIKGRITKAGDGLLRHALYEAANSLLARVKKDCALKTWGKALAQAKGAKPARVAVARKLAILMLTLWRYEQSFRWA